MTRKRKAVDAAEPTGRRVGTKKSDRRWQSADGQLWASKLESDIFDHLKASGTAVRRCGKADSVAYSTRVRSGRCGACGDKDVRQEHTYTPDLFAGDEASVDDSRLGYIEAKGYLRASDRRVLRGVMSARPDLNLCLVLQRHHEGTVAWARKFLKIPIYIFTKTGLVKAP